MACRGAAETGSILCMIKDIIIQIKRGLRAKLRNATVTGFEVVLGGGEPCPPPLSSAAAD